MISFNERIVTGQSYRVNTGKDEDGVDNYDRVSFWTHPNDIEFDDGETLSEKTETIEKSLLKYASGILSKGQTTITITGSNITADGMIDVYVPIAYNKVTPESITNLTNGSITLTFPAQTSDMEVRIVCKN